MENKNVNKVTNAVTRKDSVSSLKDLWSDLPGSPANPTRKSGFRVPSILKRGGSSGGSEKKNLSNSINNMTPSPKAGAPTASATSATTASTTTSKSSAAATTKSLSASTSTGTATNENEKKQSNLQKIQAFNTLATTGGDNNGETNDVILRRKSDSGVPRSRRKPKKSGNDSDDSSDSNGFFDHDSPIVDTRKRKGSDSSLFNAKRLIESALFAKERKERRLTQQLEQIEEQIRNSLGGASEKKRLSTKSKRSERSYRSKKSEISDAPTELQESFLEEDDDLGNHDDDDDDEISDDDDDDDGVHIDDADTISCTDSDNMFLLEEEHAALKREHATLQDDIQKMTSHLHWIEKQLEASKGHAKCLSQSTSDWAGMLKQIYHSNSVQEQQRVIRQGAMVIKHSNKNRGCGPRFIAFDRKSNTLYWSKTMTSAIDLTRKINGIRGPPSTLNRKRSFTSPHQREKFARDGSALAGTNISSLPLLSISAILTQDDDAFFALKLPKSTETIISDRPDHLMVLQIGQEFLVFEFLDAEVADSFALGLKLFLHTSEVSSVDLEDQVPPYLDTKDLPSPPHAVLTPNTPGTGKLFLDTPELQHNASFKSDGGFSSRSSIRSLNDQFELKSLEQTSSTSNSTNSSQRTSQLQKDLSRVRTKESYQQILFGAFSSKSQLILPLPTDRMHRNLAADQLQVLKDITREKSIILNAVRQPLGSFENAQALTEKLKESLKETIENLAVESALADDDTIKFWCNEILLASSRTVIEGDVYNVCHRLLSGAENVMLCLANDVENPNPLELYISSQGLVTIESETSYRVVHMNPDDDFGSPEEWVRVKARCIEHIYLSQNNDSVDERNIRSVRLEFEP